MKIKILPIQSYKFDTMNEISQQDNWNANARLWVQEDETVFKQYIKYSRITCKNKKIYWSYQKILRYILLMKLGCRF